MAGQPVGTVRARKEKAGRFPRAKISNQLNIFRLYPEIVRLYHLAQKKERRIAGLMSGTSLDGLDIALCRFRGSGPGTRVELERFQTVPYDEAFRKEIRKVFARRRIDFGQLCLLHPWTGALHARLLLACLKDWKVEPGEVDLVASHGQTVFHAPAWMHERPGFGHATLQIGDGDQLAQATGIITLSDFRQKHIAAGGEGAPLAAYGDYLLYCSATEHRLLLNIGGIANYTFLPAGCEVTGVYATDVGPGNTLIDAAMRKYYRRPFDRDGSVALGGKLHEGLLNALKQHPFFRTPPPKTTGPELFNLSYLEERLEALDLSGLEPADRIATLTAFSASCIAESVRGLLKKYGPLSIYVSGGGLHNPILLDMIREALPGCRLESTRALGVEPDAKEAVLFAALANEAVAGNDRAFEGNRAGLPAVSMGKISLPG